MRSSKGYCSPKNKGAREAPWVLSMELDFAENPTKFLSKLRKDWRVFSLQIFIIFPLREAWQVYFCKIFNCTHVELLSVSKEAPWVFSMWVQFCKIKNLPSFLQCGEKLHVFSFANLRYLPVEFFWASREA